MKLSSRSIPTGPGSRGGRWGHRPPPAYWRLWRAAHPEYRARNIERMMERRHRIALERDRAWVDELVSA